MSQHHRTDEPSAFVLSGVVGGTPCRLTSDSPAEVVARLEVWIRQDHQSLSWTVNPDWPDGVLLTGRLLRAPTVAESIRVAHLFPLTPGEQVGPRLRSHCGAMFPWRNLEFGDDVESVFGAPCVACELAAESDPEEAQSAEPSSIDPRYWKGWDDYYRQLRWPIIEYSGKLMLKADSDDDDDVAVFSVPAALAEQVQQNLGLTDRQAPMLQLPGIADEALFIVEKTSVPVPMPAGVHRVRVGIPLPPSPAPGGHVTWSTSPSDVRLGRCTDLELLACIYQLHSPQHNGDLPR